MNEERGRQYSGHSNMNGGNGGGGNGGGGGGYSSNYNDDRNFYDSPGGGKEGHYDIDKDRRMFSRKKSCWFCAKKIHPDWKDANSYNWLINEFGKISPSRITGLCAVHQRRATSSIKRGRNLGIISYVCNYGAY